VKNLRERPSGDIKEVEPAVKRGHLTASFPSSSSADWPAVHWPPPVHTASQTSAAGPGLQNSSRWPAVSRYAAGPRDAGFPGAPGSRTPSGTRNQPGRSHRPGPAPTRTQSKAVARGRLIEERERPAAKQRQWKGLALSWRPGPRPRAGRPKDTIGRSALPSTSGRTWRVIAREIGISGTRYYQARAVVAAAEAERPSRGKSVEVQAGSSSRRDFLTVMSLAGDSSDADNLDAALPEELPTEAGGGIAGGGGLE